MDEDREVEFNLHLLNNVDAPTSYAALEREAPPRRRTAFRRTPIWLLLAAMTLATLLCWRLFHR